MNYLITCFVKPESEIVMKVFWSKKALFEAQKLKVNFYSVVFQAAVALKEHVADQQSIDRN